MRALVAFRDPDCLATVEGLLSLWGYDVVRAADGPAVLQALTADQGPRLALLDSRLPDRDGLEVCRDIRRRPAPPYIYVILLTDADDAVDCLGAGADACLCLPPDPHQLRASLDTARRILELQDELIGAREALRLQATHDSLTGLWNHGAILDILKRELDRSQRSGIPVGVVLGDIDHFKGVNDTRGHLAGDEVLRQVASRLEAALRPYDSVGRYGGEEFLMVLPGCDTNACLTLAERLRKAVCGKAIMAEGNPVPVTLSLGVSSNQEPHATDLEALLRATDTALYRAKNLGRNRAETATAADVWERLSG